MTKAGKGTESKLITDFGLNFITCNETYFCV